jgi:hypothetical protein
MCSEHEKRELRQLWLAAKLYVKLAEELREHVEKESDRTTADIADGFATGIPQEDGASQHPA